MKIFEENEKVQGIYCDVPYTGVVISYRCKYRNGIEYYIALDAPITVFGDVREKILVDVDAGDRPYTNIQAA